MSRSRTILALILVYMVFAVLMNSVGTVILQSIQSFGVSKAQAGTLEGFKDIPVALASFLLASMMPLVGYRRGIVIALVLVAAACAVMAMAEAFWATRLLFVCIGAAFGLVKVAVYASIGLLTDDRRSHASLTNVIEGFFMVGMWAGYWLFAAFIDSNDPGRLDWLSVYWVLIGICLLAALAIATSPLDESAARNQNEPITEGFLNMLRLTLRPLVLVFVLSAWLYVLIEQSIGTWLPTFNNEVLKLPSAVSVQMGSLFAGALAIGRLAAGLVLRVVPWHRLLAFCVVAMAALVLATLPMAADVAEGQVTGWSDAPAAAYLFPLIGLFMAPIYPVINSVMLSALPQHRHAAMTGLIVIASALGGTTGSMLTGVLFGAFGGQTAFYLSLLPMAAILVALHGFRRQVERNAAAPG